MLIRRYHRLLSERLQEKTPLIQVVLGPRQVGKTTTAKAIFDVWKGPRLMLTADSATPPPVRWLQFHWEQARLKGSNTLLIIDEVQKVYSLT